MMVRLRAEQIFTERERRREAHAEPRVHGGQPEGQAQVRLALIESFR